jgi:hypothetical protein
MRIFKGGGKAASENEAFIRLIEVAQENEEMREQLLSMLALDDFNRKSALNSFLENLQMSKAPPEIIEAVELLLDDTVAKKAANAIRASAADRNT